MNIEVGEYIRTKDGIIAKCIEEKQDRYVFNKIVLEQGYYNNYILKDIPERANFIIKHSKNIIDLVEIDDYVNGHLVIDVDNINTGAMREIYCEDDKDFGIWNENIKSIVTKEQFSSREYRV
jgi:hypothetical protein